MWLKEKSPGKVFPGNFLILCPLDGVFQLLDFILPGLTGLDVCPAADPVGFNHGRIFVVQHDCYLGGGEQGVADNLLLFVIEVGDTFVNDVFVAYFNGQTIIND